MAAPRTLSGALRRALPSELGERDGAVAALATLYAKRIDDGGDVTKFGPLLQAALVELHMTPRARAAVTGKVPTDAGAVKRVSTLDELRQRRAARLDHAAVVDPAARGADA